MDFSRDVNGWDILLNICAGIFMGNAETAKRALLIRMLHLVTFELKTYATMGRVARMLACLLRPAPELEEAFNFLLTLVGTEVINTRFCDADGFTVLHRVVVCHLKEEVSMAISKGPYLYPLGFDNECSPRMETPASLAMYLSPTFAQWRCGLIASEVDLENFVEQELRLNHVVHPRWEKQSLLDLFAYMDNSEFDDLRALYCSDCNRLIYQVRVQPHWRHLLERIKQGFNFANPSQEDSDICEGLEVEAESKSESNSGWEVESSEDPHGYPATISIRSECIYAVHELVCMDCWLYYIRTGTRGRPRSWKRCFSSDILHELSSDDSSEDSSEESSEDEYSPYHLHC